MALSPSPSIAGGGEKGLSPLPKLSWVSTASIIINLGFLRSGFLHYIGIITFGIFTLFQDFYIGEYHVRNFFVREKFVARHTCYYT